MRTPSSCLVVRFSLAVAPDVGGDRGDVAVGKKMGAPLKPNHVPRL